MANQNIEMKHLNGSGTYDTLYPKTLSTNTIISDATATEIGLSSGATVDQALSALQSNNLSKYGQEEKTVTALLRKVNPIEIGPYYEDPVNFVCAGYVDLDPPSINDLTNDDIYAYLTGQYYADSFYSSNVGGGAYDDNEFLSGRYSYSFIKSKAYKLDHVTKTASLIIDLSSYCEVYNSFAKDRIIAVDDQYIYYAKHIGWNDDDDWTPWYGTIYKFNHSGSIINSYSETLNENGYNNAWVFDIEEGFASDGNSAYARSCFAWIEEGRSGHKTLHTKDYIIIRTVSGVSGTDGSKILYYTIISKNTLKVVQKQKIVTRSFGGNLKSNCCDIPIYDKNIVVVITRENDGGVGSCSILSLSESGVSEMFYGGNSSDCSVSLGGTSYQVLTGKTIINHSPNHKVYCNLILKDWDDNAFETVITSDNFNFNNTSSTTLGGYLTISYITDTTIPFGRNNYDPVKNIFHSDGDLIEVSPAYVPAEPFEYPYTENSNYTKVPYFRTDGYYYFKRTLDNKIYKMEDKAYYTIDRVVEV